MILVLKQKQFVLSAFLIVIGLFVRLQRDDIDALYRAYRMAFSAAGAFGIVHAR